ncbi:hypothetical protein FISHEDRAFT_56394 [Fistulina hepatica ATCC 64428]|uniref:Uncharacterized protein n=1 Tax=Fistulina hepatica ATCC 64428 TaxID=1128425 RepID=A0A0D7AMC9_9AGAR|nr:hypothetical protein FISHEDRAFT_56394 [Fistulina hepatica ATCC 64428]
MSSSPRPPYVRSTPPVLLSRFDEYMCHAYPNHRPMDEDTLKKLLFAMGATEDTLPKYLTIHNQQWDDIFARMPGGRLPTIGALADWLSMHQEKPQIQEQGTLYFKIPNSALAIRIWSGGMEQYGQYCLDFFHVADGIPVNTPDGYKISHVPHPGVFTFGGALVSWETAMHMDCQRVPQGTEKYSTPEGSRLMLIRPGEEPFYFQIPLRAVQQVEFAQPVAVLP